MRRVEFDRDGAVKAIAEGATLLEACRRFGVGYCPLYGEVKRRGGITALRPPVKHGRHRRIDRDAVEALFHQGLTYRVIAKRVGASHGGVVAVLTARKLSRGGAHGEDFTGQRHGALTVERLFGLDPRGRKRWLCRCDCGGKRVVTRLALVRRDHPARRCAACAERPRCSACGAPGHNRATCARRRAAA